MLLIYILCSSKASTLKGWKKWFNFIAIGFSYVLLIICYILSFSAKSIDIDNSLGKLNKFTNWDKQVAEDDEFYVQLCDDTKYFLPTDNSEKTAEKCKNEFDKLSISEVKEKKWFYEQCQNRPADYKENPDKYKDTPYGKLQKSFEHLDQVLNDLGRVYVAYISVIVMEVLAVFIFIGCFYIIYRSLKTNKPAQVPAAVPNNKKEMKLIDTFDSEVQKIHKRVKSDDELTSECVIAREIWSSELKKRGRPALNSKDVNKLFEKGLLRIIDPVDPDRLLEKDFFSTGVTFIAKGRKRLLVIKNCAFPFWYLSILQ